MVDNNKHNILYFESSTMRGLHETMESWQNANQKRFLSMSVQKDGSNFCCIALTNPTEVVILSGLNHKFEADVVNGHLVVLAKDSIY